jgi:hypothetical protein
MLKLEEIIDAAEGREIKRAIAVKMVLLGFKTKDICDLLEVSDAFVSKWKIIYENEGGLRLHYKGGPKFLTDAQRREICFHLRDKPHYSLSIPHISNWLIGYGDQTPIAYPKRGRVPAASRSTGPGGREGRRTCGPSGRRGGQSNRAWRAAVAG